MQIFEIPNDNDDDGPFPSSFFKYFENKMLFSNSKNMREDGGKVCVCCFFSFCWGEKNKIAHFSIRGKGHGGEIVSTEKQEAKRAQERPLPKGI